jgi:hydrocephalus-inducing protein
MWPDPDNEPLPPPLINSIQKKPPTRTERAKITKFSIWTPLPEDQIPKPDEENEAGENQEEEVKSESAAKLPPMTDKQTRWVLQPKESKKLFVKFFSTKIGQYDQALQFEIVGSYKPFTLSAKAICEFPTINQNSRNLYLSQKKVRPATEPESFLQKTFVVQENTFDFGPLLIGKDPEKRTE